MLTISGTNLYTGTTTIANGTLKVGSATALGATGAGNGTTVALGATLDVNAQDIRGEAITVAGTITNTGADQQNALRNVTLTGDVVFTGTNRWDIRQSSASLKASLELGNFTLAKNGTNKVAFIDGAVTGTGTINVAAGTFTFSRATMSAGTVNVTGGTLEFENNSSGTYTMPINLTAGSIAAGGNDATTVASAIAITGARDISVGSNRLNLTGQLTGAGGIRKTGGGMLILSGTTNNYATGAGSKTELNNGSLAIDGAALVGNGTNELDLRPATGTTVITLQSFTASAATLNNFLNISGNAVYGTATTGDLILNGAANGGGGAKTLTINNAHTVFNGIVSGNTAAYTKNGTGTLVFNNMANDFTKPLIVAAGGVGGVGRIPARPASTPTARSRRGTASAR
ncbi:MAG: hypothetical protein QM811_12890 [Pirellulales bacterium]